MSYSQLKYVHGPLLDQVCQKIGISATSSHKEAIKAFLKKARGIDSFSDLDNNGLKYFIERIAIFLSSELAIVIDFPGEVGVEEQDMKNFLKSIYHDTTTISEITEGDGGKDEIHEDELGESGY